ncbi:MAG: hydrogenase nickel incorporation protein HypB [Dermatophilaceae bacterium]
MGRFHRHDDGSIHTHDEHEPGAPGHDEHEPGAPGHDEHPPGAHRHDDLGDHSAYRTGVERVQVLERVFGENDVAAAANRAAFDTAGVRCVNVMSSPGAGKTALLARTLAHLRERGTRAGVVVGDIETSLDADRLGGLGAQISLVNTAAGFGGECHLDAPMVARGLHGLDLDGLDLVLVENVGNLVCPAEFDVGEHHKVMVSAVTEGEEKPLKYPVMFRSVALVLVNKIDLVPHLDVDLGLLERNVRTVNPTATILRVSARTGEGLGDWYDWLAAAV